MFVTVGVDVVETGVGVTDVAVGVLVAVAVAVAVAVTIGVSVGTMVGTGCPATVTLTTLDTPTCKLPCSRTAWLGIISPSVADERTRTCNVTDAGLNRLTVRVQSTVWPEKQVPPKADASTSSRFASSTSRKVSVIGLSLCVVTARL